ncbi:MAG: universal stress protein [Actinomycetota bacterium]
MKVLVAIDGEPPSEEALRLLIKIGDRNKIDLTVMAVEGFDMALLEGARTEGRYSREAGRMHATEIVDRTVEECLAQGFRVTGRVAEGYPPFEILHEIERGRHEVTVLGTGKSSWMGQLMLGSVSTKVLHASPTSVLVVRQAVEEGRGQILIGTDGSRGSEFALRAAIGLADPERVSMHVTSVVRLEEAAAMDADWSRDFSTGRDELMSHLRHQAESHVGSAKGLLTEAVSQPMPASSRVILPANCSSRPRRPVSI